MGVWLVRCALFRTRIVMAEEELLKSLDKQAEVVSLARGLIQMLSAEEPLEEARKTAKTVASIKEKEAKRKHQVENTFNALEQKKMELQNDLVIEYSKSVLSGEQKPSIDELQKELEATHRELKERARDCKKLEREQKALAIHRNINKMQNNVATVFFDLAATEAHVKGYIKKASGDVQVFGFDLAEPCYVADFLWDNI